MFSTKQLRRQNWCAGFIVVSRFSRGLRELASYRSKPSMWFLFQIQSSIQPHAIIILPNTDGMELLVCYEDEGVYVNTYGRITKDVVLQWGEMPTSVGMFIYVLTKPDTFCQNSSAFFILFSNWLSEFWIDFQCFWWSEWLHVPRN